MNERQDLQPADPFADLLAANRRHVDTFSLGGLQGTATKHLAVVTCVDTRIDPLSVLGLEPGDAKIVRNAGARVTDDVLRSLALVTAALGVERIAVIPHTDCALGKATDDELRARVAEATGADTTGWEPLAAPDQEASLREDLGRIRDHPLIGGHVVAAGFLYDVRSGELCPVSG
jgi:carbonic anhydrase